MANWSALSDNVFLSVVLWLGVIPAAQLWKRDVALPCVQVCLHIHTHVYTHRHTHMCTFAWTHSQVHTCIHACMHVYMHTHTVHQWSSTFLCPRSLTYAFYLANCILSVNGIYFSKQDGLTDNLSRLFFWAYFFHRTHDRNNGCFCIYLYENRVNNALYSDGLIVGDSGWLRWCCHSNCISFWFLIVFCVVKRLFWKAWRWTSTCWGSSSTSRGKFTSSLSVSSTFASGFGQQQVCQQPTTVAWPPLMVWFHPINFILSAILSWNINDRIHLIFPHNPLAARPVSRQSEKRVSVGSLCSEILHENKRYYQPLKTKINSIITNCWGGCFALRSWSFLLDARKVEGAGCLFWICLEDRSDVTQHG